MYKIKFLSHKAVLWQGVSQQYFLEINYTAFNRHWCLRVNEIFMKHVYISIQKDVRDYILLMGWFEGVDWDGEMLSFLHICSF